MAVVATDYADYRPGDTAQIFASGFRLGEAVQFQVLHTDGTPNTGNGHLPWTVVDGSADDLDGLMDGNVHTTWYVDADDSNGSAFELSALGLDSQELATTTFTDAGSTLSEYANKPTTGYQTSMNSGSAAYIEGNSIPFRFLASGLREDTVEIIDLFYQFEASPTGARTYDFLTSDTASEAITDTLRFGANNSTKPSGFGMTSSTNLVNVAIPDDPSISTDTGGNIRVASNFSFTVLSVSTPAVGTNTDEKHIVLKIKVGNDGDATANESIVDLGVFWGGHLARDIDYAGADNGSADATGTAFHMRVDGFQDNNNNGAKDGGETSLSGGDRSIGTGVVVHTTLAWENRRGDTTALLGGATFTVTPNPATGTGSITVVDDTDGVTSAGDIDQDPNPGQFLLQDFAFGTYTITQTAVPGGFFLDTDTTRAQVVTSTAAAGVVGTQGQDDPGTTDESDFHDAPLLGSIAWEKYTEAGVPQGGATFTITPNPTTGSGSLTVVDDTDGVTSPGDVDKNPLPGQFLVSNVLPNTYTITETVAPAGYLIDDAPSRTVTVVWPNLNVSIGTAGVFDAGNTNTSDFADRAVNAAIAINAVTVDGSSSGDSRSILSGETISWQYTVTNTGNVPLSSINVTDSHAGITPTYQSGDLNKNNILELNETWIYTATKGTAISGSYTNTGTATGQFTDSAAHVNTATASDGSSYFGASPQIAIVKVTVDGTTSGDGLTILTGEPISWRYTVTNTGNIALSSVSVTDSESGVTPAYQSGDTNTNGLLDVTETWIYSASGTAVAGSYSNTGTASGKFTDSAGHAKTVTASNTSSYFGASPQIAIDTVTVDDTGSGDAHAILSGEAISWKYVVTNTGNIALANVTVTDNKAGVTPTYQMGDVNNNGLLDLHERWVFSAAGTAITGNYSNIGTAKANFTDSAGDLRGTMASDGSSYFGATPKIAVNKVTIDGALVGDGIAVTAGDAISWQYTVTNTGNVALASVSVSDDQPGVAPVYQSGDVNANGLLDLTETWVFSASGTAISGKYSNIGTANGSFTDDAGHIRTVMATDSSSYIGIPDIVVIANDAQNTSSSLVKIVNRKTGQILTQFYAYETNFQGGVHVAMADMNGDGTDEIITSPGRGRAPEVRVFKQDGTELTQFRTMAYASTFTGGVDIAVGDVNGDGKKDLVTVPTFGATQARVFFNSYNSATPLADPIPNTPSKQFAVFSSSFLGGADVAVADVGTFSNGSTVNATRPDGKSEIIIGNGSGMRSTIYVYDVTGTPKIVRTILPFSSTFKGGITLDTARVNSDAIPDIIVSAGNGSNSAVEIWSGLTNNTTSGRISAFTTFADTATSKAPVHAVAMDTNFDGIADTIIAVQGTDGASGQIRSFSTTGVAKATLTGFSGSWHITRLRSPLMDAIDQAFAVI